MPNIAKAARLFGTAIDKSIGNRALTEAREALSKPTPGVWQGLEPFEVWAAKQRAKSSSQEFPLAEPEQLKLFAKGGAAKRSESTSEVRATPRSGALGAIADATKALHDNYLKAQAGYSNPVTEAVSTFLGIPAFAEMMDRLSYGESPFKGKGQTLKVKDWAIDGLVSLPAGAVAETGLRTIRSLPAAIRHGATEFAKATAATAPSRVIKPKGAQTVTSRLESELDEMKKRPLGIDPEQRLRQLDEYRARSKSGTTPEYQAAYERERTRLANDAAINKWIQGPLRKYIMRDMGTPDDPVRKLADEGIVHAQFGEEFARPSAYLRREREAAGFPAEGMATTPAGQRYETMADYAAGKEYKAGDPYSEGMIFRDEPAPEWYRKLEPGTDIYEPQTGGMEFGHIIDVLSEDLAAGRIRPDQLSKVSMEQAVRRTYQYDLDKAAAMEKAAVEETGRNFPIHREYPQGFKWVELKAKPAERPEDLTPAAKERFDQYISAGVGEEVALNRANTHHVEELTAQALKNEGEIMGHCVGGYCEDVLSGDTRIFSLRDPKGRSHVTVEVSQPNPDMYYDVAERALRTERRAAHIPSDDIWERAEQMAEAQRSMGGKIEQIKGKQNLAPIEDYQPYVADFVRSDQWAPDIGDFNYTDMVKIGDKYIRRPELQQLMKEQGYAQTVDPNMAIDWFKQAHRADPSILMEADQKMLEAIKNFTPPPFADGGTVNVDALRAHYFR